MIRRDGGSTIDGFGEARTAAVTEIVMRTMKSSSTWIGIALGVLLTAVPVLAHHAFTAEFDSDKPVTLHGALTKMEWSNPHGWIYLDVKDPQGVTNNWAVEFGTPNELVRRGLRMGDFVVGSQIVIAGFQAKDGTHTATGRTLTFADGREFFVGAEGTPVLPGTAAPRQ